KKKGKKEYLAHASCPLAVAARGSPARGRRPRVTHGRGRDRFFSHARRRSVSPRGETDRGDAATRTWSKSLRDPGGSPPVAPGPAEPPALLRHLSPGDPAAGCSSGGDAFPNLSLQSVYIAARSNLSLPTVLIVASIKVNTTSSGLSFYTATALLRNSRAHRCPVFLLLQLHPCCDHATCSHEVGAQPHPTLLLPSSSSTVVVAFRLRSLGCHLPIDINHLKNCNLDDIIASPQNRSRRYYCHLLPPPLLLLLAGILHLETSPP
ncbi:hypothetical protein BHM03_00042905, partial [Ensete ventricosum]